MVLLGQCSTCPIDIRCSNLPNITTYNHQALDAEILQLAVNISTTTGLTFRPNVFKPIFQAHNMDGTSPTVNGCEGFYNFTSQSAGLETPCPWRYECDYNPQRIPAFMFHAHCNSPTPRGGHTEEYCDEVHYPVSYIKTTSCDPLEDNLSSNVWTLETIVLPITCNLRDMTAELGA